MRKWVTRMREKHVDDVSRTHTHIHTYRSTAIFSYTQLVWGSLRLATIRDAIIILINPGHVQRGYSSLSVYQCVL